MFTDDFTMFSSVRDSSDTETIHVQMQQYLNNIQAWGDNGKKSSRATQIPDSDHYQ